MSLPDKSVKGLCNRYVVQRQIDADFMRLRINGQMQFTPDTTSLFSVLFDFLFALTEDLQSCGITHQMRNLSPGWAFKTDVSRSCSFAETTVIHVA